MEKKEEKNETCVLRRRKDSRVCATKLTLNLCMIPENRTGRPPEPNFSTSARTQEPLEQHSGSDWDPQGSNF